jgi:ABC-2 type transport system permease protein
VTDTTSAVDRLGVLAYEAWRASLAGRRGLGLLLVAAVYPVVVLAIGSAHRASIDLVAASELLYSALYLPVLLLLVCLVLAIGLFRGEVEDETIVYPIVRNVPRPVLVVGKFLGFVAAALVFLLPAALLGPVLGAWLNTGPQVSLSGVGVAIAVTTTIAIIAYGAFFLLLGLVTRSALVLGLVYGFLWEAFVPLLPGPLKELTLVYYLREIGGRLTTAGPLSNVPNLVSLPVAIVVPLLFALGAIVSSCVFIMQAEFGPSPSPA